MFFDIKITRDTSEGNKYLEIMAITVLLTAVFHFLPADHPMGIAFAIFVVALAIGMVLIAALGRKPINSWAYVFLLPVLISAVAQAIYASPVVQGLGFVISLSSLCFFAFWLTVPKLEFKKVREFWPAMFIKETIWPFGALTKMTAKIKGDKRLGGILIGIIIALPFLMIFIAAFASADQLFAKSFSNIFQSVDFRIYIFKTIRDIIVVLYLLAAGGTMLTRLVEGREPADTKKEQTVFGQTVFVTFLGLINVLFLIFVGFQFAYFFGGESYLVSQGITYANYAREGFFQLLFVAGVVFAITWVIYWITDMQQRWTKIMSLALIVQTGIIIASALKRLMLYIDVYGLTLARWWAAFCIILIGLTLLMVFIAALKKIDYSPAAKFAFLGVLIVSSLALLVPSENIIANYNVDRFLSGKDNMDIFYLERLSSDAMQAKIKLAEATWTRWPGSGETASYDIKEEYVNHMKNTEALKQRMSRLGLGVSLSDYLALQKIEALK
ncbi:MAG: DUF4173 domain-containing protein [Patescibacteria group bacterium]|nr:DUF4173 domain-containing protein [Patescibacteria group bacterium]